MLEDARFDPRLPLVEEIVSEILTEGDVVTPIELLLRLEILTPDDVDAWRRGRLPYLERAITAGFSRVGRLLRLLAEHALARGLVPEQGKYVVRISGKRRVLRFSKRGDDDSERTYSTHYVRRETAS